MDKPYLIGRATAIVERLVDVPSDFVAMVQVNPLQKLTYHLKEALKKGNEELIEIVNAIGNIPSPFVDSKAQFYIGYYHQKSELEKLLFRKRIGYMITDIRKSKGLSLEEVSQKAKVDLSNLSKIERGRYNVGIDILGRIADALGVNIEFNCKEMEPKEIKTLEELAQYINSHEDWMLEVNDVIEKNGWEDETGISVGICHDGKRRLLFDNNMNAVVVNIK